jgi:hypothetical protein
MDGVVESWTFLEFFRSVDRFVGVREFCIDSIGRRGLVESSNGTRERDFESFCI